MKTALRKTWSTDGGRELVHQVKPGEYYVAIALCNITDLYQLRDALNEILDGKVDFPGLDAAIERGA